MELIEQSEKSLYEKCKYEVKLWEHNFKKANGRLPSRLDIKEANSNVRNAYKTYFRLKTAALEKSFMGIDGFHSDEDQPSCDTPPPANTPSKTDENYDSDTYSLPDKTWGKHLNKKPIEKSHSEPLKPSANLNQKFVSKLSIGSKLVKRNPRKSLSQNKLSAHNTSVISTVDTDNSIPIICSYSEPVEPVTTSEEFLSLVDSTRPSTKNIKIVSSSNVAPKSINIINNILDRKQEIQKLRNVDVKWLERVENSTEIHKKTGTQLIEADSVSDEDIIENSDDDSNCSSHVAKRFKYSNNANSSLNTLPKQNFIPTKLKSKTFEMSTAPISTAMNNSETSTSQRDANMENSSDTQPHVKEDVGCIKSVKCSSIDKNELVDDVERDIIASFKKKNLNENFVRINMKKKIYARGKKTMNFSNYKKKLWKSRKKFNEEMEGGNESTKPKFAKLMPLNEYDSDDGSNILETLDKASGEINPETAILPMNSTKSVDKDEEDDDNLPLAVIKQHLLQSPQKNWDKLNSHNLNSASETASSKSPEKITKTELKKGRTNTIRIKTSRPKVSERKISKTKIIKSTSQNSQKNKHLNQAYENGIEVETEREVMKESSQHFNDDDDFNLLLETIRIENIVDIKGVYPLYSTEDDGSVINTPPEVFNALRLFGHESFREGQEKAVMRILSGRSTLVTSSTGSGKSLCYQLPAYLFRQKYRCITLVISPLISLMEDQIKCMPKAVNAVCLHGNQTKTQRDVIIKALTDGDVSILMVSPESILSCDYGSGFGSILSRIPPIAFACLDEAHCLSQWSHNFRPSYLVVCQILQEKLGIKTILGLTATATQCTRNSLIEQLQIPDGEKGIIRDTPIPTNLKLTVSRDMNREQALLQLLLSQPFEDFTSIIIYCLRRNDCEKVASFLRASLKDYIPPSNNKKRKRISSQVEAYHAGLSGAKRKTIQYAFTSGELRIVVATVAFGMGINKADIRSVIHYNMPASFESYVQEIGRAGRDRLPAHCHIFLDRKHADVFELRRHIYGTSVDRHIIRKLLRKVFIPCKCEGTCLKHEILFSVNSTVNALDIPEEVISTLLCYLELHERKYIKVLKQSYGKCKVTSYGGSALIHKTALTCEPLKCGLKINENEEENLNSIEFSIMKVSKQLNYDTGICKQILKNLEWTSTNGQPKRSALNVEFSDLSFHLLSPGNLPDEDLDEVLDTLYEKVVNQENIAYAQLIDINETLSSVAVPSCKNLIEAEKKSEKLKADIRKYFESEKVVQPVENPEITEEERNAIIRDIKLLVDRHGDENFTGRSIARIFHGIPSPNFQPRIWGRTKFWRSHLAVHFNTICKIATSELIKNHS